MKQPEIEHKLRALSVLMAEEFEGYGHCILLFEFGQKDTITNYISNAKKEDLIHGLRQSADMLEQNRDMPVSISETMQ